MSSSKANSTQRVTSTSIANTKDKTRPIFGLQLFRKTSEDAMDRLVQFIREGTQRNVFFVNAHTINSMFLDVDFANELKQADLLLPDGIGIEIATRFCGDTLEENLCGTDLIKPISKRGFRLFLLGGKQNTAKKAGDFFSQTWGANIVGSHHGFTQQMSPKEKKALFAKINGAQPDIVLVGMGVPLQEQWISENRQALNAPIVMGVGGLFDYYSGNVKRAPLVWRKMRAEWVYRLIQEPRRLWKRYIWGNPAFLVRMFLYPHEKPGT